MLRVLKPGRKLALAVWNFADTNPFFYTVSRAVERHAPSPPPEPDAPDAFRFAMPGKLRDLMGEAGVVAPVERLLRFTIHTPVPMEEYWTLRCEMSERMREKLARFSGGQLAEVKREAFAALAEYSTEGGMSFPAEVLIVSGSKAGGE